jgi:hypothetical protein
MERISARRISEGALIVMLVAFAGVFGKYLSIRHAGGTSLKLAEIAPYITAALLAAMGTWAAVLAYFAARYRITIAVVAGTLVALLIFKLAVLG